MTGICRTCSAIVPVQGMEEHSKTCNKKKMPTCRFCNRRFNKPNNLDIHLRYQHRDDTLHEKCEKEKLTKMANTSPIQAFYQKACNKKIINDLIQQQILSVSEDENQELALQKASEVECLVKLGADIEVKDPKGMTPLHLAVVNGKFEVVKILVHVANMEAKSDITKMTPLHYAVRNGHSVIVLFLIEKGAPIDAKDANGSTPLHIGLKEDQTEIAKILIQKGAQIDAEDFLGCTPLNVALNHWSKGHREIAKILFDMGAKYKFNGMMDLGWTYLHFVVDKDHIELAKYLIGSKGVQIDAKGKKDGNTPLHIAARNGNFELAKLLVEHGANIEARNDNTQTPYYLSNRENHKAKAKTDGDTPLHIAAHNGKFELVKLLVEHGANIGARNDNNQTPYYLSNRQNHKEISKYLLEKKREVESQTTENISNNANCIICEEKRGGFYVLNPCGHASLCEPCCVNLIQQNHAKCPSCRKPVKDYIKMFFQAPSEK